VRYRWRDIPALLRTQPGRWQLRRAAAYRAWPLLRLLASGYRRSLLRRTRLFIVVGSLGKTSTTRAVAEALGGNVGPRFRSNQFGFLALSLLAIPPWRRKAVIEVGISGPGQMTAYASMLRPDVTVVTSIASEHRSSFGTLERTRNEKAEMVRALGPSGVAVLNSDDPHVRWMAGETAARVVTYGLGNGAQVRGLDPELQWPTGLSFTVSAAGKEALLRSRIIGKHMVYPLLAAVAVALNEGVERDTALQRLEGLEPLEGSLQPVRLPNGVTLLRDDRKSPVESIEAALDVLAEIPARRRIAVLGDVTEPPGRQSLLYARLGERVGSIVNRVFFVGRAGEQYRVGTKRAGLTLAAVTLCGNDLMAALAPLRAELAEGDVVLLKGRYGQRIERLALALQGADVRCNLTFCDATHLSCSRCAMLTRGWRGRPAVERKPHARRHSRPDNSQWRQFGEQWLSTATQRTWRAHNDRIVGALVERWSDGPRRKRVLKTDLFEEAIGDGLSALLQQRAEHVVGIDVSTPVLRKARILHHEIDAVVGDVREFPFSDNCFDLVVSTSTLDHFATYAELRESLRAIARLLAPGGELILTLDNLANPIIALRNRISERLLRGLGLTAYHVGVTCGPRRLARYLKEAGLEVTKMTAVLHVPRLPAVRLADRADRGTLPVATERLRHWFEKFERLERLPTRYLTGYFVAALAVKPRAGLQPAAKESEQG
jgi:UDP-N-acetylmuramoyl-tripeptide--D-alanyl-D-alanine ligase